MDQNGNKNKDEETTKTASINIPSTSGVLPPPKSRKKLWIGLTSLLLAMSAAGAYIGLVYIPNSSINVFNKAVSKFISSPEGYTLIGKLDQGGVNDADYGFSVKTNKNNESEMSITVTDYIVNATLNTKSFGSKSFVQFNDFLSAKELAKKYRNSGNEKTLALQIADFADTSDVYANNGKWLEIPSFVLEQPQTKQQKTTTEKLSVTPTVGGNEDMNGKPTRKYSVSLSQDEFFNTLTQFGGDTIGIGTSFLGTFADSSSSEGNMLVDIWVNTKTKTVEQISYQGRPFKDATLELKITAAENSFELPGKTEELTTALSFGIVSDKLFSKEFQAGATDADKERIADLKGIKMAIEIYKNKNGSYPERYNLAVNQQGFISEEMTGASSEVFKDPNGRFIGLNGSQYSYVPSANDGNESCSGKDCTKYFIITSLDDGTKYQLNSD